MPTPCKVTKTDGSDEEKKKGWHGWVWKVIAIVLIVVWFALLFSGQITTWLELITSGGTPLTNETINNILLGIFIVVAVIVFVVLICAYGGKIGWQSTAPHWRVDTNKK